MEPATRCGSICFALFLAACAAVGNAWAAETDQPPASQERDPDYPKVDASLLPLIRAMPSGVVEEPVHVPWRLYVPAGATSGEKLPLIFFLHGAGRRGGDNIGPMDLAYPFWSPEAQAKHPCFVLAPQCRKGTMWTKMTKTRGNYQADDDPKPEMVAALAVLDQTLKAWPIDERRVYVVGMSMGGFGTWDALFRRPKFWAAAIPICGGGDPDKATAYSSTPIWAWHGANDQAVLAECSRQMIAALKEAGGNPRYTELPNVGHGSWTPAFADPELHEWLFAQKRPDEHD